MIDIEKLNKLGYDSISLEVSGTRGEINYIDKEFNKCIEEQEYEDKYVINVFIDIFATNRDTQEKENIGKLTGNYFESEIVIDDISFYDLCDSINTDLEHMASAIVDEEECIKDEICEIDENLMYIDRIYINEKFRGLGMASYVINSLNEILEYSVNLSPNVLILLPAPQKIGEDGMLQEIRDEDINKQNKEKLYKLYEKLGFKKLEDSNYMIKRTKERYI